MVYLWQTTLDISNEQKQNFVGDKVITVIDSRQARLQKIITILMAKFKSASDDYIHLGYESVTLSSDTSKTLGFDIAGKQAQMSGRKGLYVNADRVYDLLKSKTTEAIVKRHPEMNSLTDDMRAVHTQAALGTDLLGLVYEDTP